MCRTAGFAAFARFVMAALRELLALRAAARVVRVALMVLPSKTRRAGYPANHIEELTAKPLVPFTACAAEQSVCQCADFCASWHRAWGSPTGFMATPRVVGRIPRQRVRPAFP